MKLLAILALAVLAASHLPAQTEAVIKTKATDALTESIVIPSGKSVTIASGATITAASGSTVTGFGGTPAWGDITGTPTTLAGYGISDAITAATAASTYAPIANPTFVGQAQGLSFRANPAIGSGAGIYAASGYSIWNGTAQVNYVTSIPGGAPSLTDVTMPTSGTVISTTSTGAVTNTMLAGSIALSKLSITGTPNGTKFLRDDGTWAAASTDLASPGPIGGTTPSTGVFTQLSVASGTLTDSAPVTITQAWNDAAEAFTGIRMDITSTASASSSSIIDLRIGGTSNFRVSRSGGIYLAGGSVIFDEGGNINGASNAALRAGGRGYNVGVGTYAVSFSDSGPVAKAAAQYLWTDSTASYAGTIDTGIARSAAGSIQVTDGSTGYGTIQDLYRRVGSGSPEGVITAPVGCIYHRTDTGDIWRKTSGTGNTGWVTP